jgi:hypothetical protein
MKTLKLLGTVVLIIGVGIFTYKPPWIRFSQETPSVYVELARIGKHLLEQETVLLGTAAPNVEGRKPGDVVVIEPCNVNFSERVRRYNPLAVKVCRPDEWVHVLFAGPGEFGILINRKPMSDNWWVRLAYEGSSFVMLWEGDDSAL